MSQINMTSPFDGFSPTSMPREAQNIASLPLTTDAETMLARIRSEWEVRSLCGLATAERMVPRMQIADRLEMIAARYRDVSSYVDSLTSGLQAADFARPLVIGVPVAGFGAQEYGRLDRIIAELARDTMVREGFVRVLVFANRPSGTIADGTAAYVREEARRVGLPLSVIEGEVPTTLGRTDGPLMEGFASAKKNRVPIALIRDILSISTMRMWIQNPGVEDPPVYLQMDIDFEGFARGGLDSFVKRFSADPRLMFLQGTSRFDDKNFPTADIPLLSLGDELMRELPLLLKLPLSQNELPDASRIQIICGEAIQRGIQVPQAERLESIARRGGYGLLRMPDDELDANFRLAALANEFSGVACCDQTIFSWNNRRAILAFESFNKPPISQWAVEFCAVDVARDRDRVRAAFADLVAKRGSSVAEGDTLKVVNDSLMRFPIPRQLPGVYVAAEQAVAQVLARCGILATGFSTQMLENGAVVLQADAIREKEFV